MYRIIVVEQVFIFCFILNADHVFLKITKTERSEIKYAIRILVQFIGWLTHKGSSPNFTSNIRRI